MIYIVAAIVVTAGALFVAGLLVTAAEADRAGEEAFWEAMYRLYAKQEGNDD